MQVIQVIQVIQVAPLTPLTPLTQLTPLAPLIRPKNPPHILTPKSMEEELCKNLETTLSIKKRKYSLSNNLLTDISEFNRNISEFNRKNRTKLSDLKVISI